MNEYRKRYVGAHTYYRSLNRRNLALRGWGAFWVLAAYRGEGRNRKESSP